MTDSGFTSTADDQTAWIETLGWFAGWALPLALVSADVGTPPAENPAPHRNPNQPHEPRQ
jgi:outer membrane translocation and assembly module TamA